MEVPGGDYSYRGLANSGNVVDIKGNNEGIYRLFGQSFNTAGNVYWFSVVMDVDSNPAAAYAGLSLFSSTDPTKKEKLFIGQDSYNTHWSMELSANTTRVASTTLIQPQTSALLVFEIDGINQRANLYVNPTSLGGGAPVTPSATLDLTGHEFSFDQIRIQSGGTQVMDADEVRFGTTYADVTPTDIPEARSWLTLVIGLAALGMLRCRYRTRAVETVA